ncbi:MAG TPA: CoA transferase [Steroidobacteraceae bacterium]|nr:CoA transferase [Steroidobacteraceae bacterium]
MSNPKRPLDNLSVMDFGLGLPGALVTRMLADTGAQIRRFEPSAGDPFYERYPCYSVWRRDAQISKAETLAAATMLTAGTLATADVCVIGGEEFPGVDWKVDVEELARSHPRLVILEIGGYCHGTPEAKEPAVDLLVQAYSGLVHEQYSDRPMLYAMPAPSYGAALQGLVGLLSALVDREQTGKGQIVRTSLFEGALCWLGHSWFISERSDWSMDLAVPKDVSQLMFRCADDKYLHFALVTANARANVYGVLGIDDTAAGAPHGGLPSLAKGARNFYGDVDLLQSYIINWKRADLLEKLWALGVAAEPVNKPGEVWDDEQVVHNGTIWREADGVSRVGLPFTVDFNDAKEAPRRRKTTESAPPLQGVRIVDFGTFAAGPHSSMILGDLGADVIKVESIAGDPIHNFYRPYSTSSRGKRHLAIDMKKPQGLEIARRLCRGADIIHHNFRPGVAERLGIDAQSLHQLKPSLIILETSGYGASGPKSQGAGIDWALQALCGHEEHAAGEGNGLTCYNLTTVDFAAGMLGAVCSLAAQLCKERTGAGATVATSLLETGLFLLSELVRNRDGTFMPLPKLNYEQTGFHPAERLYKARDSWIAIAARTEEMAQRLLVVLGLQTRINRPRRDWGTAEAALIADAIAQRDAAAVLAAFQSAGVWSASCRADAKESTLRDPTLRERGTVLSTQHARYGEILQIGSQFTLSRARTRPSGDTASIGQHSREILPELGYSDAEIAQLYAQAIVVGQ